MYVLYIHTYINGLKINEAKRLRKLDMNGSSNAVQRTMYDPRRAFLSPASVVQ